VGQAAVGNHCRTIERLEKKALIGIEFERVRHKSGGVRNHAVG
jgi:hypothetical protein